MAPTYHHAFTRGPCVSVRLLDTWRGAAVSVCLLDVASGARHACLCTTASQQAAHLQCAAQSRAAGVVSCTEARHDAAQHCQWQLQPPARRQQRRAGASTCWCPAAAHRAKAHGHLTGPDRRDAPPLAGARHLGASQSEQVADSPCKASCWAITCFSQLVEAIAAANSPLNPARASSPWHTIYKSASLSGLDHIQTLQSMTAAPHV